MSLFATGRRCVADWVQRGSDILGVKTTPTSLTQGLKTVELLVSSPHKLDMSARLRLLRSLILPQQPDQSNAEWLKETGELVGIGVEARRCHQALDPLPLPPTETVC